MHAYMNPIPHWGKGEGKKQRAKQCISGEREFVWGYRVDGILEAMESGWRREYLLILHVEMGWKRNGTHLVTRLFAKYHPLERAHDRH